jgi:hypothetical protein
VGTVLQDRPPINHGSQPRWARCERADLFEPYRALRAQGLSERQAAQELKVPRTTLPAWRVWHDTLDICHHVAEFLQSGPGLAFVPRLVLAFHLVCVAIGACGMRLVCLFLHLTGLDRFVAASYGAQQQVNRQVEQAIVAYGHTAPPRWAKAMPPKDRTGTQADTFTGGLCLITMAPESHFIILAQLAQARAQTTWHDLMAPALAPLKCRGIPSTSDAAPGLLASVEPSLEAPHAPAFFQVQPELVKAVSGPMATKARAAHKAVTAATEQLDRLPSAPPRAGDEPAKRHPRRPPQAPASLAHAEQGLAAARREHHRLAAPCEQGKARRRGIGHDSHCVDLERGVRRHGQLSASDIPAPSEQMRTLAQHEGLSQHCVERLEQAERVVPKRHATSEFVSGSVKPQGAQLALTPPVSFAMHAKLIPSY